MARRLKALAEVIKSLGFFEVEIVQGYCSTDRHIPGTRLRHEGKGRRGNRLVVKYQGTVIFDHNAAETYWCNQEVEDWLEWQQERIKETGKPYPGWQYQWANERSKP